MTSNTAQGASAPVRSTASRKKHPLQNLLAALDEIRSQALRIAEIYGDNQKLSDRGYIELLAGLTGLRATITPVIAWPEIGANTQAEIDGALRRAENAAQQESLCRFEKLKRAGYREELLAGLRWIGDQCAERRNVLLHDSNLPAVAPHEPAPTVRGYLVVEDAMMWLTSSYDMLSAIRELALAAGATDDIPVLSPAQVLALLNPMCESLEAALDAGNSTFGYFVQVPQP